MAPKAAEFDQFQIRLPPGMRDKIKAAADANKRSMNAEIVSRLEEGLTGGPTRHEVLYVLLDADGFPSSWDEILTHLSRISEKGNFSPAVVAGRIFNVDLQENDDREENWLELVQRYRTLNGLPPEI